MPKKTRVAEPNIPAAEPKSIARSEVPAAPAQNDDQVNFFERLNQFSAEEWRSLKLYVYRIWPVIDRKENEHFLAKISQVCDEDYLLSTFGTGKYYLRLNDGRGKSIASHTLSVYNPDFPPRVNPDEVVASDPQNERYFKTWAKPKTDAPAGASPDSTAVAEFARVAIEKASQGATRPVLDPQILSLWEKTNGERDALAHKLAEVGQKQPATSPLEPVKMLRELLQTMRELQRPAEQAKTPVETVKEIAELVTIVRELAPPPPAPVADSGPGLWSMVIQAAGPVVAQIVQALAMRGAQSSPPPIKPGLCDVNPIAQTQGTASVPDPMLQFLPPEAAGFIEVGKDAIEAIERGISGDDFAHALVCRSRAGEAIYAQLSALGKEGILGALSSFPSLAEQIAPRQEAVAQWLDAFMSYGEEDNGPTVEDSTENAAQQNAA